MRAFEPSAAVPPLGRQQSVGSRPRSGVPVVASPPRLPPRRGSRGVSVATNVSGDRSTLLHLRRSELAGWRTKSVFPSQRDGPNPHCFLPILKLRGLPFFCTRKHVCQWLGDLAAYLKDIIFVLEVDSLTTGFGLVTFHTSEAAYEAWQKLHKAAIVGKRFVEVFALFPPHCPLSRRVDAATVRSNEQPPVLTPPAPPQPPANGVAVPEPSAHCCFCGFPYWQHGDAGAAAFATLRLRRLMETGVVEHSPGLMHTAFLKVPALLFQDAGAVRRHEIDSFDPDAFWRAERGVLTLDELAGASFFDLLQVEAYHMRLLIAEIVDILLSTTPSETPLDPRHPPGTFSIADIGNRLSTRARAYLFLTETKLKNVLETFDEFFVLSDPVGPYSFYSVSVTAQLLSRGSMLIWSMQPYQLSRRGRRRDSGKKRATPSLALGRAISCAVSRPSHEDPPPLQRTHTPPADNNFSQVLVDFIKSAGLDSLMSADAASTTASSRRLSHWTPLAIPPPLEALTPANRSRTCPGRSSPQNALSPVAGLSVAAPWMLVSQPNIGSSEVPTPPPSSCSRQELLHDLLKQREEVDAKIEQALYSTSGSYTPKNPPSHHHHHQGGLGTFANDLMPLDNALMNSTPFEDLVIPPPEQPCFDACFDDILFDDRPVAATSRVTDTVPSPPTAGGLSQVEVSELLRALNR
eukprot:Protomagalhaensia_sp_Gyna_25__2396@NODE_232_length_4250_cov_102_275469_g181_i0_p1_GENE_NODE_232_length_4250_cov_102_275469_g181_i0NODE_232_length_4250_cov_102_275469_g181_i0_p1_ORF_typecomplete_len690_score106_15RRM_1/PF00076_22/0_025Limkainb1/PF11608_8/0_1_NODE_232_length_4250_cov_102_275469_g181_i09242993